MVPGEASGYCRRERGHTVARSRPRHPAVGVSVSHSRLLQRCNLTSPTVRSKHEHGSTTKSLNRGYKVVSVSRSGRQEDFLTGFIQNGIIHGRPADIFRLSDEAFLVTDDKAGVVYYISRAR